MSALNNIFLLIVFICVHGLSYATVQEEQTKYKDYNFIPEYAEINTNANSLATLNETLKPWREVALNGMITINNTSVLAYEATLKRSAYMEYGKYFDEVLSSGKTPDSATWQAVSVIENNNLFELLRVDGRPKKDQERQLWPLGSLGGYEFFGCLYEQPVFKANLFNDETPDLFVVTGTGYQDSDLRGGGISGSLALHIFNPENYKEMLQLELTEMNYKPKHPEATPRKNYYYPKSNYPARNLKFENNEGRKRYSKLFIKDFDQNNKLDLLVWTREYKSRKVAKDSKPGFELTDNKYTWYEENNTGTGFNSRTIDIKMAEKWLDEFSLTWTSGWPNETLCTKGKKSFPLITIDDDPILKK